MEIEEKAPKLREESLELQRTERKMLSRALLRSSEQTKEKTAERSSGAQGTEKKKNTPHLLPLSGLGAEGKFAERPLIHSRISPSLGRRLRTENREGKKFLQKRSLAQFLSVEQWNKRREGRKLLRGPRLRQKQKREGICSRGPWIISRTLFLSLGLV